MALTHLFIDLDETLVHSAPTAPTGSLANRFQSFAHGDYVTILRPEAHAILSACRDGAEEVILFTFGEKDYAQTICDEFEFGFQPNQILSCEHLLLSPKDLAPAGVLIDDKEPDEESARVKMAALGIGANRYLRVPPFRAPEFASCRLFVAGLPAKIERLAGCR